MIVKITPNPCEMSCQFFREISPSENNHFYSNTSSLAKIPIRFSPLPLGGFRQVFNPLFAALILPYVHCCTELFLPFYKH